VDIIWTATFAFVLAGFVKGVLGFGFPIIALIVLTLSTGLLDALAIIIVPTLFTNIWQALSGPFLPDIFSRLWRYFAVAIVGILIASQFLTVVNVNWLTLLLGGVLFVFALSRLRDVHFTIPRERENVLALILGTVNGLLTGLTGSFMVPSVLYMQALGFGKDMLVQAMGTYFALSTVMLTISLGNNKLISLHDALVSTTALVPSFVGIYVGRWTRDRVDEARFQKLFLVAVLVLGAYIAGRAGKALI